MIKYLTSFLLLAALVGAGCGVALAQAPTEPAAVEAETVTTADLGVPDPGLLPTNPFYFLKEWGRTVRRVFTLNPVSKAELELRISNEKAAEAKKVEELRPEDVEAIREAIQNYQEAQARLKARFEALRETSQNPNVDRLLEELADRTVKHEKLFDELAKKFEGKAEIKSLAEEAKEKLEESVAEATKKDEPAKFAAKLEKALTESKGSELKHVRSLEILDRLNQKAPEEFKQSLERLRQDFSVRLRDDLEEFLETEDAEKAKEAVSVLPGDTARRAVILREIQERAGKRVAEVLERANEILEKNLEREEDAAEKAAEQIRHAEERIKKLESAVAANDRVPAVVKNLLNEAQNNLKEATAAFEEGKYGEAFGQARSAEVLARNGLRILEEERPQAEDLEETLEELAEKINKYESLLEERGFTPEKNPDAYKLLENARLHLGFAKDAFAKNDFAGTKLHIGHVKGFLNDLSRILEGSVRTEFKVELRAKPAVVSPAETSAVRPAQPPTAAKPLSRCEEIKRNLDQLWEMFKAGKISERDYNLKYEAFKKEYAACKQTDVPAPAPVAEPTSAPVTAVTNIDSLFNVFVAIDENGQFSPVAVRVKKGGKVTWTNKSARAVWPASAIHPTHELYSGFDALRGLETGETYSFVFEKVGSWKYHDHLNSGVTGMVEVVE